MINDNDLQRLAAAAHALRPDWPIKSLLTYLHAQHVGRPYRDLAVALAWVAADTATKTPKRLEQAGPWWDAAVAGDATRAATPTRPADTSFTSLRCEKCGFLVVRHQRPDGEWVGELHTCGRVADAHEGAARARAEIQPTVRYEKPETEESPDE